MKTVQFTKGPVPESIKTRTREQFLASEKASLSGDDLYWILYRAASESSSLDAFANDVAQLLDAKLGAGAYILALDTSGNGSGGTLAYNNPRLPNTQVWGGDAGVLPGIGAKNSITCFVFWG